MNRYNLYCTPEQTKKALELGTPIQICGDYVRTRTMVLYARNSGQLQKLKEELVLQHKTIIEELIYNQPTAEQMLGWLEEKYIDSITIRRLEKGWEYTIIYNGKEECMSYFSTRKEATIAAIDAAIEYLTNNKKL